MQIIAKIIEQNIKNRNEKYRGLRAISWLTDWSFETAILTVPNTTINKLRMKPAIEALDNADESRDMRWRLTVAS